MRLPLTLAGIAREFETTLETVYQIAEVLGLDDEDFDPDSCTVSDDGAQALREHLSGGVDPPEDLLRHPCGQPAPAMGARTADRTT